MDDYRELDARAVRWSIALVEQAFPGDLGRPTPCGAWTLAELLAHMAVQHDGFADDAVLTRRWTLPELATDVAFSARRAMSFHFVDDVVHSWDVARTLGVAFAPEPDLLAAALEVAQAVPDGPSRVAPGAPFAPGLDVADDADTLNRIVAMLGRDPGWMPPT